MTRFRWLTSPQKRDDMLIINGGVYDTDQFKSKIPEDTLKIWIEDGFAELVDESQPNPEPEPEPEPESVTPDTSAELERVKGLDSAADGEDATDNGAEDEVQPSPEEEEDDVYDPKPISAESGEFPCPHENCDRHKTPYTMVNWFVNHMNKEHGEDWVVEDGFVKFVKKVNP